MSKCLGFFLCAASFICGIFIAIVDKIAEVKDRKLGIVVKEEVDPVSLRDIKDFNIEFWLVTANCVLIYMCYFPFMNISADFYQIIYGFSDDDAGFYVVR